MKNKFLKSLYGIFQNACVIYSLCVLGCCLIAHTGNVGNMSTINLSALTLLAILSLWLSLSVAIFKIKKLNVILRTALHFVASAAGIFVTLFYGSNAENKQAFAFAFLIFFSIAYVVAATAVLAIRSAVNKKKKDDEDYSSVYKKG